MVAVRLSIVVGQNVGKNDRQRAAASGPGGWLLALQRRGAGLDVNTTAVALAAVAAPRSGRFSRPSRARVAAISLGPDIHSATSASVRHGAGHRDFPVGLRPGRLLGRPQPPRED